VKLTRQGVRDLNYMGPQIGEKVTAIAYSLPDPIVVYGTVTHIRSNRPGQSDGFMLTIDHGLLAAPVLILVADRHLWARGWDTEEAKALCASEALR
jgi:hypothetical protein